MIWKYELKSTLLSTRCSRSQYFIAAIKAPLRFRRTQGRTLVKSEQMSRGGSGPNWFAPQTHAQKAKRALTVRTSQPGKWQPVPRPSSPQDTKAQEIKFPSKNPGKHGPPFPLLSLHPSSPPILSSSSLSETCLKDRITCCLQEVIKAE